MSSTGLVKRGVLATVAAVSVLAAVSAGQAFAAVPWWHVNTLYAPASKTGGESAVEVEVSNLGDAPINASASPVTVSDNLPSGLTVDAIHMEGGGASWAESFAWEDASCSTSTVSCRYTGTLRPYERLIMAIDVTVTPGSGNGANEVIVKGGGIAPYASTRILGLEGPAPSFGVEGYELTAEEEGGAPATQAGSHPFQLTTTLQLNTRSVPVRKEENLRKVPEGMYPEVQPLALTKDLRFNLPPGLVGNPTPLPKCSLHTFTEQAAGARTAGGQLIECPLNTVVGVATPVVTSPFSTAHFYAGLAYSNALYSLEPSVGEPARFGFLAGVGGIITGLPVILDTSVRTGGDYGVTVTVPNIINLAGIYGSQVTFWGVPQDPRHDNSRGNGCLQSYEYYFKGTEIACPTNERPQPLLIMPSACTGPLRSNVEADPWEHAGTFTAPFEYQSTDAHGELFGMDGCNRLSFEPSISVTPDGQQASTPTGLTVDVHVPQDASLAPTGDTEATVKDTTVSLPAGVGMNPAGADGLASCSLAQIGLQSSEEQTCPEAAKVGTVEIHTPLLPNPLRGAAYLAAQDANPFGSLVALYIVAKDPVSGVLVKLAGQVTPDPVTGQLVSTFKDTPQLPFEDLALHFFGGSRAPLGTPALCGSYTTSASIAPWSGNAPVNSTSTFDITSGPDRTACPNPPGDMSPATLPFAPELTSGSLNIQAGAFTPFTMTMSRQDGNQNLDSIQLKMPPGLLGTLSGVKLCAEPQADQGTCGPESLIGHTIVSVGLGGNPYTVTGGEVFITGSYDGAPYGLSIVNPAKAGPFDLGKVIVRAKIEVDPVTAALTVTSDTTGPYRIPTIIDGIPLQIKHVNVTIDRSGFTFNPTNCEPQHITGGLTSSEGATSALSVPFQVTNCAILKFKPVFKAFTNGKTSRADGASLTVNLTYPSTPFGQGANIRYVKVELPKQLPSRLETLKKACLDTVFDQNPAACPTASRVGTATATTPVIPVSLTGPAYFVSHGGAKFPELIVVLSGYGTTVYLHGETFIDSKTGITSSTFKAIPDVPVGTFQLTLPEGPYSALAAPGGKLCTTALHMPTTFIAQNGRRITQSTAIAATGCARHKTKHHGKHKKTKKSKHGKKH